MASFFTSGATFSSVAGDKAASITPTPGLFCIVVCMATGIVPPFAIRDDNPDGLGGVGTWVSVGSCVKNGSTDGMHAFVRAALIQNSTLTNFTATETGSTGGGLLIHGYTGMTLVGANAIRSVSGTPQFGKQDNQAAAGTPAPTLPAAPLTSNVTIAAVLNASNPSGITDPTGWTQGTFGAYNTPTTGYRGEHRDSGGTAAAVPYTGASATAFCSLVFELDTSAGAVVLAPPIHTAMQAVTRSSVW